MAPRQAPTASTVLVVASGPEHALIVRALEDEGHTVVSVANAGAAIATCDELRAACVVMHAPREAGLDLRCDAAVVILCARDADAVERALAAGADEIVVWPSAVANLMTRVGMALRLRRLKLELPEEYALIKADRDERMRRELRRERLVTFLVHDLGNPLRAIDLHAQRLERDRELPPGAFTSVARIRSEARRLQTMIGNMLELGHAGDGRLATSRARIDLAVIVADVLRGLELTAVERGVALRSAHVALHVHADAYLLRRILTNLVDNAIRRAPPKTSVLVDAVAVGGDVEIRVTDAGAGVSPELRERIFDSFVLTEGNDASRRAGWALGLAFCKLAVESHDGAIWLEDATRGATFCLRLPVIGPEAQR